MLIVNERNIRTFFKAEICHDGDWNIKPMLAAIEEAAAFSSTMRKVNAAMELADTTIRGHGVEEIVGFRNSSQEMKTVALYVNTGDIYNGTIIYDCLADKLYVGTYGDWVEWREKNKDYGLGENDS
jgi:hypothetical protein